MLDESHGWDWEGARDDDAPEMFTVEYTVSTCSGVKASSSSVAPPASPLHQSAPETPLPSPSMITAGGGHPFFATLPSQMPSSCSEDGEAAPRRYRMLEDCINNSEPVVPEPDELLLAGTEEPTTFAEADLDPARRTAMQEEIAAIIDNKTLEAVELPAGHHSIG